jgi:hypothetical protein
MRLYLDDDSADALLVLLLRKEGHAVFVPTDFGLSGAKDPVHFRQAIQQDSVLLTHNYEDYELLHDFLLVGKGRHFGLLLVRKDNDPTRDLKPAGIVRAIRNLLAAGIPLNDECIVLNHWR